MSTTTSLMGLSVPASGDTNYPTSISDSFTLIDQHDHTTGKGTPVGVGGIANNAVTTATIAAGAVTPAKKAALGQQLSASSGTVSVSGNTPTDVPGVTVTITTTGRPVMIALIPDTAPLPSPGASGVIGCYDNSGLASSTVEGVFYILEDGVVIAQCSVREDYASTNSAFQLLVPASSFWTVRAAAAGAHTYKLQMFASVSSSTVGATAVVIDVRMIAYEL